MKVKEDEERNTFLIMVFGGARAAVFVRRCV